MHITEFYRDKTVYCKEWFDGRWLWYSIEYIPYKYAGGIEWMDLFGKHPDTKFTIPHASDDEEHFEYQTKPVTRRFVLLQSINEDHECYVQVMELDWSNVSYKLGPKVRNERQHYQRFQFLIDRHCQDENLQFLQFKQRNDQLDCIFWRLIANERRIEHIGEKFKLPCDSFGCFDLNNGIITGVSASLEKINMFDPINQQMLSEITINGLPKSVDAQNSIGFCVIVNRQFYFSSIKDGCSTIYCIDLDTNSVKEFTDQFDGHIIKMIIGMDNHLYVQLKKELSETTYNDVLPNGSTNDCLGLSHLNLHQFIRIPIKEPESLLFMSVAANTTPLPINVKKSFDERDDIPKGLYEDFKLVYFVGAGYA